MITVLALVGSTTLYATGVRRLWLHAGTGHGIRRWEVAAFAGAIASLALALVSPLASWSQRLFSAHMTQHEILMLVSAPLFAMSQPAVAYLWAFPRRRWHITSWVPRLTAPFAVFVLHAIALWIWHVPALYEAALASERVHGVQHFSFFVTAALFWWGMVHGRYGRAGYGVAVLYVFLTALHSGVLGALATVAERAWYPSYASNPLSDQQLAGLIMWIPSGVVFILFGLALLAAWLGESERRANLSRTAVSR